MTPWPDSDIGPPTFIAFNFSKAFDRVNHRMSWLFNDCVSLPALLGSWPTTWVKGSEESVWMVSGVTWNLSPVFRKAPSRVLACSASLPHLYNHAGKLQTWSNTLMMCVLWLLSGRPTCWLISLVFVPKLTILIDQNGHLSNTWLSKSWSTLVVPSKCFKR